MLDSSKDYQSSIYAPVRKIDARVTFTQGGTSNVYDDNYITQVTLVEEMSTLNDTIPSDELQVTLDNTGGIFDFLNYSNMNQVLAQRPSIKLEFGLEIQTTYPIWSTIGSSTWNDIDDPAWAIVQNNSFASLGDKEWVEL